MNKNEEKCCWIIAVACELWDGIDLYKFYGDINDAKKKMVNMIKKDKNNSHRWDYGSTRLSQIEHRGTSELYGYGCYSDYHINYTARKLDSL